MKRTELFNGEDAIDDTGLFRPDIADEMSRLLFEGRFNDAREFLREDKRRTEEVIRDAPDGVVVLPDEVVVPPDTGRGFG